MINELRITSDADGAFSIDTIENVELAGHEILWVPLTFAPPLHKALFTADLEFRISHLDHMDQRVELRGSSVRPCVIIEPHTLDFGKVAPGCSSREVSLKVSNTCATPVEILSFGMNEGEGSDVFAIRRQPMPPPALHLGESVEFTMVFQPSEVGRYQGVAAVEILNAGPSHATVFGEAAQDSIQTDTFDPTTRARAGAKVDVLWVTDPVVGSKFFKDLVRSFASTFFSTAYERNVDFQLAVNTSGHFSGASCDGGNGGHFLPGDDNRPRILTSSTPDLENHFALQLGGTCFGSLPLVEAAYRALSEPEISGLLRPDAALSIIFFTEMPDQSTNFGRSLQDYLAFFRSLKAPDMLRIHAITGSRSTMPSACNLRTGDRLHFLMEGTGGTWVDICTNWIDMEVWKQELKRLSDGAFDFRSRFVLRGVPGDQNGDGLFDEGDIELRVNGEVFAPFSPNKLRRWTYDPIANTIDFDPQHFPRSDAKITVTYQVACVSP